MALKRERIKKSVDDQSKKSRKILCLYPNVGCMNESRFTYIYIYIQTITKHLPHYMGLLCKI